MEAKSICIGNVADYGGGIKCFSLMKEFSYWIGRGFNSKDEFVLWYEFDTMGDDGFKCKQMYADVMNRPLARVKCSYPMNLFYVYEDEVPPNTRVSTPEDCELCKSMMGTNVCEDSPYCLLND